MFGSSHLLPLCSAFAVAVSEISEERETAKICLRKPGVPAWPVSNVQTKPLNCLGHTSHGPFRPYKKPGGRPLCARPENLAWLGVRARVKCSRMKKTSFPISVPDWSAASPAESFQAFAVVIHEQAKQMIVQDGTHAELFFLLSLDGSGELVHWQENDREGEAEWLRGYISERYTFGVIHVVECWMRLAPKPDDHILKQVMAGEIKVSELNPEHRTETLMVSSQSRDGHSHSWLDEIIRQGDGRIVLGLCHEINEFAGRFGKLFG